MAKRTDIVELLQRRIQHGDYALKPLPPETKLAEEMETTRFAVRKAIAQLLESEVLVRQSNGRVSVNRSREQSANNMQIAFLQPSHPSFEAEWYREAALRAAASHGATLRPVLYLHWDDALIQDALNGFDGVFFMPFPEDVPPWLIGRFQSFSPGKVVILDQDLSGSGVQSVCLFPPSFVQRLLDHLAGLGHRRVDCFNVHPLEPSIQDRIEQWELWKAAHGIEGKLYHEESKHTGWFSDQAYAAMRSILERDDLRGRALMCTAMPAAIGAMRAMNDLQIRVGRDVSVCTVNDDGVGRYFTPSITSLVLPDAAPYLSRCIQKMKGRQEAWTCPLLLQLYQAPLFIGESTGRCPAAKPVGLEAAQPFAS